MVEFFKEQKNLNNITCYSNEANKWEKSNTTLSGTLLSIEFRAPFEPRRGRVNCSLNDKEYSLNVEFVNFKKVIWFYEKLMLLSF